MHQALNVKDASIFGTILNITQLLDKYGLKPDEIRFGNNLELYLSMKDVTVNLELVTTWMKRSQDLRNWSRIWRINQERFIWRIIRMRARIFRWKHPGSYFGKKQKYQKYGCTIPEKKL